MLQQKFFGKSSEKTTDLDQGQKLLFNEAEDGSVIEPVDDKTENKDEFITVPEHKRKKTGRKPIPANIPREERLHDLPEEEKKCSCCGKERPRINEHTAEELDIIPAEIKAIKHIYPIYGPCACEASRTKEEPEVIQAPAVPRIIPKSIVAPGLLAHILVSKFCDSLPFYRQEKMFDRIGIGIGRANMCNWTIQASSASGDILEMMWQDSLCSELVQMDETTVQVLKEPGRAAESKSYMWVTVGYKGDKKIILYHYHPSRSQQIPLTLLKGYTGYLQTDGYEGYDAAMKALPDIIHVGCFAHARRKFVEAGCAGKNPGATHVALAYIQEIYKIEKILRNQGLAADEFVAGRKQKVIPVLEKFHDWLVLKREQVPPSLKLGGAINYTLNEWPKLIRYLDAACLTPDNNRAENAIRPFVLGRKNWLFSDTPLGAHASAAFYSIIETA
ncbi:MAG: IS66 family transposase, partial [Ignavibacteria bacterium]